MDIIKPTIGRKLHFYPRNFEYPDLVIHQIGDDEQPGDDVPECSHARWMGYQLGQAARTEAAEQKLANREAAEGVSGS